MNKTEIAEQIRQTEEKLANLRKELEKPDFPTLADAKPGDMLENGCVVVEKFVDANMALIVAPIRTTVRCHWSKNFEPVFNELEEKGFRRSDWFIPNFGQLQVAFNNCKDNFGTDVYWSSSLDCFLYAPLSVHFGEGGKELITSNEQAFCARAFSLVSY